MLIRFEPSEQVGIFMVEFNKRPEYRRKYHFSIQIFQIHSLLSLSPPVPVLPGQ
jgi:hypothetical protein